MNLVKLFLTILPSTFGYNDPVIKMSIDYFLHRNVKFVCLLSCENAKWNRNFAKYAFISSIAISHPSSNKTDLAKCLQRKNTSTGILIEAKCGNFEDVLNFASQYSHFDALHKWFIIEHQNDVHILNKNVSSIYNDFNNFTKGENEGGDFVGVAKILNNLNISVDADITVAKHNDSDYNLYEIFNFGKVQHGNLVINKMGMWDPDEGLQANFNTYKYYRRWDFQRLTMRLSAVMAVPPKDFDPEMITGIPPAPGVADITQTSAIILKELAEIHNFRFHYTITDRWLSDYSINSSQVAASSLYFRTQDITPVLRFILGSNDKIDFVHPPVTSIEIRYFYRIPTHGPGKFENQFLRPLSRQVWIYFALVLLLSVAVLMLAAKLEQRPSLVQYSVFSVAALFCQQSFDDNGEVQIKKPLFGRKLTMLVAGITCLLIYNYYTSSVVSWLLNGPPPSINSLQDLLESPLELIYEDAGYDRSWLQTKDYYFNLRNAKIEDEIRKKKIFNKKRGPLLMSNEDGIKMMRAGGYAFHMEVNNANQLISRSFTKAELCELWSLPSMDKISLFISLQKNSPFKEFFVWSTARLKERGIISCVQHRTRSPSVKCEGSSPRALALGGAAPAFLLLAAGYLLATTIMFLERLHKIKKDTTVILKK